MTIQYVCEECEITVQGANLQAFGDAYIAHVRSAHPDWTYPDAAIRNYAEATQRLSGSKVRLGSIGRIEVHRVTEERLDDWLAFFDHDAFADNPGWASCYCTEPHLRERNVSDDPESMHWRHYRETMIGLLRSAHACGYLAYVDGRPAGWVNASKRSEYALYRLGTGSEPADDDVIGISCFVIAPPYRRHGLASALLDSVLAEAVERGATYVEAYPADEVAAGDAGNFRGLRSLFEAHGFTHQEERDHYTVVRRRV